MKQLGIIIVTYRSEGHIGPLLRSLAATLDLGQCAIWIVDNASPDATVVVQAPEVWAAVLYTGHPLDSAISDGVLTLSGDRAAVERLLDLFPMPESLHVPDPVGA